MGAKTANLPPRKQHIRDDTCHRVDSRAIIIGTRLEKKNETKQRKETQRFQTNETQQAPGELKDQIVQNDLEYADGAQLLIERTHMGKYANEWETMT